jgi:nucleoside-diphosphate-sugar epimerase
VNKNRALILGGAGFIGSHIAEKLLKVGYQVGIVDGVVEGTGGSFENIADWKNDFEFVELEPVRNAQDLVEHIRWADYIVDGMAFTGHLIGFQDPVTDVACNLMSHLYLVEALKSCPGKRVIYLASRGQYGAVTSNVVTEESPCRPLDPQGINKLAAEHFLRIYGPAYGFETASLRITNCFGPRQKLSGEIGLVGAFIKDVLEGRTIEVFGSPDRVKNVVYVRDVARIVLDLMKAGWKNFELFNVGGVEVSIQQLLEQIFAAAGKGRFILKSFPDEVKKIDVGEARFSDAKLNAWLGCSERTAMGESIPATVDYVTKKRMEILRK